VSEQANMLTLEGRRAFVADVWPTIATWAYRAYQEHGRGAVIIRGGLNGPEPPEYIPLSPMSTWPNPECEQYARDYDPKTEVVIIFVLGDVVAAGRWTAESFATPKRVHKWSEQ